MTKKRIIIGMDGTWQSSTQPDATNVYDILGCIRPEDSNGVPQLVKHFNGVGADSTGFTRFLNGTMGLDLPWRIIEAYDYLAKHYTEGDDVAFIGFSRGSYTARSLNGMVYKCGIVDWNKIIDPDHPEDKNHVLKDVYSFYKNEHSPSSNEAKRFRENHCSVTRPQIDLACFDTVGALGIPRRFPFARLLNRTHEFHDTTLNRNTRFAAHAKAVDEHRDPYDVTPMEVDHKHDTTLLKAAWFAGDHGSIGGGCPETKPFADQSGLWMIRQLEENTEIAFHQDWVDAAFTRNTHLGVSPDAFAMRETFGNIVTRLLTGTNIRDIPDSGNIPGSVFEYREFQQDYKPNNDVNGTPLYRYLDHLGIL